MKKEPEYLTIPVFRYDNIQLATVIGIHVKPTSELCPMKIKNKEKPGKTRQNCAVLRKRNKQCQSMSVNAGQTRDRLKTGCRILPCKEMSVNRSNFHQCAAMRLIVRQTGYSLKMPVSSLRKEIERTNSNQ